MALSCDIRRRKNDGLPYANHSSPDDPGVAIYFSDAGEGEASYVLPCDAWSSLAGNLKAIAITVRDLRRIGKRGVPDFQQRAYSGFKALPGEGESAGSSWWEVLDVTRAASMDEIDRAFRREAKRAHPDRGGSRSAWDALQQAYEQAKAVRK